MLNELKLVIIESYYDGLISMDDRASFCDFLENVDIMDSDDLSVVESIADSLQNILIFTESEEGDDKKSEKSRKRAERLEKVKNFVKDHKKSLAFAGLMAATTPGAIRANKNLYRRLTNELDRNTEFVRNNMEFQEAADDGDDSELNQKLEELEKKKKKERRKKRLIGAGIVGGSMLAKNLATRVATRRERDDFNRAGNDFMNAMNGTNPYYDA